MLKKELIFYYDKETKKFTNYQILNEYQLRKIGDLKEKIKQNNDDKTTKRTAIIIDDENIKRAWFYKNSYNFSHFVDDIEDSFNTTNSYINSVENEISSLKYAIEKNTIENNIEIYQDMFIWLINGLKESEDKDMVIKSQDTLKWCYKAIEQLFELKLQELNESED